MNIKCGFVEAGSFQACRIDGWNLLEQGFKLSFGCSRHITPEDQAKYSLLCEAWLNGRNGKPQLEQRRGFDAGWIAGEKRGREKGASEERARVAPLVAEIESALGVMEERLRRALGGPSGEESPARDRKAMVTYPSTNSWRVEPPVSTERDLLKLSKRVARI